MNKLSACNVSIFYTLDLKNPLNNQKRLVVIDREIKSLAKDEIENERKRKKKIIDSLDTVAELSKHINVNDLTEGELQQLNKNYQWINTKIQRHNKNIDNHFVKRVVDRVLKVLTGGKFQLKYKTLEHQIQFVKDETAKKREGERLLASCAQAPHLLTDDNVGKLTYFLKKFSLIQTSVAHIVKLWPFLPQELRGLPTLIKQLISMPPQEFASLPRSIRVDVLLAADDQALLKHYQGRSFFTDFKLNALSEKVMNIRVYEKEKNLLLRMIKLNHKETLLEVQNTPILRHLVVKELALYLKTFPNAANTQHALQAIQNLEKLQEFIPQENLLQILIFIRENSHLLAAGKIGTQSQSRPNVRKVTISSYKLEYQVDKQKVIHEIIVKLGKLGEGAFKVVNKQLLFSNSEMPLEALGKQPTNVDDIADRELYFLRKVRGVPHVIQFHEVKVYYSKRKWKQKIQALRFHYYNMGELLDHVGAGKLTLRNKLQIVVDIFKGVQALHRLGIIHRDIKLENILLEKVIEGGKEVIHAFVSDLGLACEKEGDFEGLYLAGTAQYLTPALNHGLEGEDSDFDSDAFACGMTLYALFNYKYPLPDPTKPVPNESSYDQACKEWDDPLKNPRPKDENSIEYVIWKLLRFDKSDRMGIDEALRKVEALLAAKP